MQIRLLALIGVLILLVAEVFARAPGAMSISTGGLLARLQGRDDGQLGAGLAADGADLTVAPARVPGDRAVYTWRGPRGPRFSPGRLDFLLYGGGMLENGFAFDAARLHAVERAKLGVRARDSAASDHLALVLDLRPTTALARGAE